jgi:hypothetical protein
MWQIGTHLQGCAFRCQESRECQSSISPNWIWNGPLWFNSRCLAGNYIVRLLLSSKAKHMASYSELSVHARIDVCSHSVERSRPDYGGYATDIIFQNKLIYIMCKFALILQDKKLFFCRNNIWRFNFCQNKLCRNKICRNGFAESLPT